MLTICMLRHKGWFQFATYRRIYSRKSVLYIMLRDLLRMIPMILRIDASETSEPFSDVN